jgi:8-hydroxy-5-deazaflavin:NADPH oxidoreductase
MKVGVIGSGEVGEALARGFLSRHHDVMLGSRDPRSEKMRAWLTKAGARAATGTFAQTAAFGDLALFAVGWSNAENAIRLAGPKNLSGKIVIDVTNPLKFEEGKPPGLAVGFDDSAGETVQRWLPDARVVKAFNIVGNAYMIDPQFPGGPPTMFICGNDATAKKVVDEICAGFGWEVVDIGGIEGARLLEPLAILWVRYGVVSGTWDHAFKLLRK